MRQIPIIQVDSPQTPNDRPMELIIKPTEACNFKCTFCSSTQISEEHTLVLDLERIFAFLHRFPKTSTIIVNGGDPLMVKPEYYWKIIEFLDLKEMNTSISFTTNLWAFYKKPAMWVDLFRHPRVGVTTSFQYGNDRLKGDNTPFSEEDFWKISDLMLELVGYRPDFISVVTDENQHLAIGNVILAKRMNVECKLNYAMASGDQDAPYMLSKIYEMYTKIYDVGLMPWEFNTKQMAKRLSSGNTMCPQNRACDQNIRSLNPQGDYYSCGAFGDDQEKPIDFNAEVFGNHIFEPLANDVELFALKTECITCPMFNICNGCKKTIKDMKRHNMVEEHCSIMKSLAPTIIQINYQDQPEEKKRQLERV